MPRLEKTKKGTPDRTGRNPFTGEPMVFRGIPGWVKFWEVAVDGADVVIRRGIEGAEARTTWRRFATPDEAHSHAQTVIAGRRKQGYELSSRPAVIDLALPPRPPVSALSSEERAVLASPDDPQAYASLERALAGRGSPRAELMAAQRVGDEALAATILLEHERDLLGPLARHQQTHDGTDRPAFAWRWGFIHEALISTDATSEQHAPAAGEMIATLIEHASGRYLRSLRLGRSRDRAEWTYDDALGSIAAASPSTLRKLVVGDFLFPDESEISWVTIGDASALWQSLPALEEIEFQGADLSLGDIDAPRLRRFEVRTGGLSRASLQSIAASRCPELESLVVWLGDEGYGGDGRVEDLAPLFAGRDLPKLRHLGLMNTSFTDELCEALVDAPILARLTSLDLSMGTLSNAGAKVLLAHRDRLRHLDLLVVSQSFLSSSMCKQLAGLCPSVDVADQRSGERYVSVGE